MLNLLNRHFRSWCCSGLLLGAAAVTSAADVSLAPGDSIDAAVIAATDGDRLLLTPGEYVGDIDLRGKLLVIEGTMGPALTVIRGSGLRSVIRVRNGEPEGTTLRGVTITGGDSERGGAVDVAASAHLTLDDCVVTGNAATEGGGIACRAATLVLHDVHLLANIASDGDALSSQNGAVLALTSCTIEGRFINESMYLDDSQWTITDCLFTNRSGRLLSLNSQGLLESTRFDGMAGGAVKISGGEATIRGCVFEACRSTTWGGAIDATGTLLVQNSDFTDCAALLSGGALYVQETARLEGCWFEGGLAEEGGLIGCREGASLELVDCELRRGYATSGGAVFLQPGATMTGIDVLFHSNDASYGGAIFLDDDGKATLSGCDFLDCEFTTIYTEHAEIQMSMCTVGPSLSGAWSVYLDSGLLQADDCTIHSVFARGAVTLTRCASAGGARISGRGLDRVRVDMCEFIGVPDLGVRVDAGELIASRVEGCGRGAEFGPDVVVTDCEFVNNGSTSIDDGGGITVLGDDVHISGCLIEGNIAGDLGGGIWVSPGATGCRILNCEVRGNEATEGGGLFWSQQALEVTDTIFASNEAVRGGAVAMSLPNSATMFVGCDFSGNRTRHLVTGQGGAIHQSGGTYTLQQCTFENNRAGLGGALYGTAARAFNCRFSGNEAANGGAWWSIQSARAVDCVFEDNHATSLGGAIGLATSGVASRIGRCEFTGNTARMGGGIRAEFSSLLLYSSRFVDNEAMLEGGGVSIRRGDLSGGNCIFIGNRASTGGGLSWFDQCTGALSSSTFLGNAATVAGAAVEANFLCNVFLDNTIAWAPVGAASLREDETSTLTLRHAIIEDGWGGAGMGVTQANPMFVDEIGPDGSPATGDEDLRLQPQSPAIDVGDASLLPADGIDLDGDGQIFEPLPVDIAGRQRVRDGDADTIAELDLGAYEYACQGDVNDDGAVDFADLTELLESWGQMTNPGQDGDVNADGTVNFEDLTLLLEEWGLDCTGSV